MVVTGALMLRRRKDTPVSSAAPFARTAAAGVLVGALTGVVGAGGGFCPGPAVVSVVTLSPTALAFVAAMLVGMAAHARMFERARPNAPAADEEAAPVASS